MLCTKLKFETLLVKHVTPNDNQAANLDKNSWHRLPYLANTAASTENSRVTSYQARGITRQASNSSRKILDLYQINLSIIRSPFLIFIGENFDISFTIIRLVVFHKVSCKQVRHLSKEPVSSCRARGTTRQAIRTSRRDFFASAALPYQ